MCRDGNDADIAVALAPRAVEGADGHEPCILATGAGVGLQRHGIKTCDGGQLLRQVLQGSSEIAAVSIVDGAAEDETLQAKACNPTPAHLKHLLIALCLVQGREGVHVGELRPGDGDHLLRNPTNKTTWVNG